MPHPATTVTTTSKMEKSTPIRLTRVPDPSEQSILSATIVAEDCITADAYATAFMAMGLEKAREAAKNIPGIEYYVIYSDENGKHQIEYSTGMLQYLPNRPIEAMLNE